jgi:hypothetical protein
MGIERAPFLTDDRQAASTTVLHRDRARAHLGRWRNSRGMRVCALSYARRGGGPKRGRALFPVVARETVSPFHRARFCGLIRAEAIQRSAVEHCCSS